jgi:multidrug transporter EmrE-like cation transporter
MKTPAISIVYFLIAALVGALGQYLYKSGADKTSGSLSSYILNPQLLAGVLCYIAVMVLFIAAFKRGGTLSVLYPIYSTTFIWAAIIALVAFQEPIRPINILGMLMLTVGMFLMGVGNKGG